MDVPREDEICARVHERAQNVVAARDRPLVPRPPRRADQVVVEHGNAQRSVLGSTEPFGCALELRSAERAALVPKRTRRVEPDDVEPG